MKKLFGVPHASWLYPLTIALVVLSLLFSPLAGLGSISHARDNGSIVPQIVTDLGNLSEPTQVIPNVPPVISGVQVTNIASTWATVVWTTDKPADTVVHYGTSIGLGLTVSDAGLTTDHSILLSGLEPGVTYYYEVQSTDYSLNTVTDNNGGVYYSFTTLKADITPSEPEPAQPQKIEPLKATAVVSPDKDVELKSPSGKIVLDIPAGAASENLRVDFTEETPWGSTGMKIVNQFELNAYAMDRADAVVSKFDKELQITIKHSPEDLRGLDVNSLRLFYFDETSRQWVPVSSSKYNNETMVLTATVSHFSQYGEQANPTISGPGKILASQTNLHTGTAVFTYPVETPPGRGGLQPNIEFTYDSGVADEMKNKRSVGSWVGIGWTLDFGSINYDEGKETYSLQINGVNYGLDLAYNTSTSDGQYFTVPESFLKVTKSGSSWTVLDQDGTTYGFSHLRHCGSINYRFDLTSIQDIHGNTINITYVEDLYGADTRSAYPDHVTYNDDGAGHKVDIKFNSSWDFNDILKGGCLRNDNPEHQTSDAYPIIVVENRKLDSIEVKLDNNLVRKYVFAYNTTPSYLSGDYGGIWYSGKFTLTSITEVGADGVSVMPATIFTYTDLPTRMHDTNPGYEHQDYNGNPGNPATFNWPHLTSINNGYGGNVTLSYTEKPSSTAENIWTREVVTSKTVNPGIGPVQTYTYTYTGDPQYLVPDANNIWDSSYRGFSQVRETDAAGNYVQHYYYTTGSMLNEYLTSREYKTEWYDSSGVLQKKVEYTWNYKYTGTAFGWTGERPNGPLLQSVAVDSAGNVYATDSSDNKIIKYDSFYNKITEWGSSGSGPGQFNDPTGIAIDSDGHIWVADLYNARVQEFNPDGSFRQQWSTSSGPGCIAVDGNGSVYVDGYGYDVVKYSHSGVYQGLIAANGGGESQVLGVRDLGVDNNGYVYVLDIAGDSGYWNNHYHVKKYTTSGVYVSKHGGLGTGDGQFYNPMGIWVDGYGNHWVVDGWSYGCTNSGRVQKFNSNGGFQLAFGTADDCDGWDVAVSAAGEVYLSGQEASLYVPPYYIYLSQVDTTTGTGGSAKTSRTRYIYDNYGNVITEYRDGDLSTSADDATVQRVFYPNTTAWILDKPARERVYATITGDVGGANLKAETRYYYDGANNDAQWGTPPTKGDLTRLQQYKDASNWVNSYYTYDTYGNRLTEKDPNNNTTTYVYDSTYHVLPISKQYPMVNGLIMYEYYAWDYGSGKITSETDVNGNSTTYEYDTFKRIIKAIKPGDSSASPTIQYQYNNWGTINQQHLKTLTKLAAGNYTWQSQYFDGVGRVVQTQAQGETGYTVIDSTIAYNNCGLVDKEYVSQVLASGSVNGYYTPAGDWKYRSYAYEGLQRVSIEVSADGTYYRYFYDVPWREQERSPYYHYKNYYYDASGRLVKVEECDTSGVVYSTTTYSYDVLNNLVQVKDNSNNTSTMNYDWLSRKTSMSDPDMGSWSYTYDNNGNLQTQTDAKSQAITFTYDALNRLTGKSGTGLSVSYTYDSTTGGNMGLGQRTGMTDASGNTTYKYDARGRLIQESHTIDSGNYTLQYGYDSADRLTTVMYPTGETVTQTYNGRGSPYSLSGSVVGNIVTSTLYNKLGQYTEINLNNGIKTTFGYYGVGGTYDTSGDYYGRLWEIKSAVGANVRQDTKYVWDAEGNLYSRQDVKFGGTETFTYDFLNRLTAVSGNYTQSYSYNQIGNILTMNSSSYTYGTRPHAVTQVGSTTYSYDNNGNMIRRGNTTITWDVENRPTAVGNSTYVYDGDSNRVKKIEGGVFMHLGVLHFLNVAVASGRIASN